MLAKPEILAPAGNLAKLKVALTYGADAVYVGVPQYGLRQGSDNLSYDELNQAVVYAHDRGKKIYVAMNAMPHYHEMQSLQECLKRLDAIGPDALIVSDAGLFSVAKKVTSIPLHVSTQASVTNAFHARMWAEAGAKRVILAREVSLTETQYIHNNVPIELETFVHGSMCTSYSGKCTISNYTAGRDSNRGGCVHSCRYAYQVHDAQTQELESNSYIMNARDLMAVRLLPDILRSGLDSLKLEGRMKSPLYVAQACRIYRKALDHCWELFQQGRLEEWDASCYEEQLSRISNRTFTQGNLDQRAFGESLHYEQGGYVRGWQYAGMVRSYDPDKGLLLEVRFPFTEQDQLILLTPDGAEVSYSLTSLYDICGQRVALAKPNSLVYLPSEEAWPAYIVYVLDPHVHKKAV